MKTWDLKYLIDKKNKLINRYCISRSENERYKISQMINTIDDAIEYITPSVEESDYDILDSLDTDIEYYNNLCKPYLGDVTDLYTRFYFNLPKAPTPFQKIDTCKSKIITTTHGLFEDVKKCFAYRLKSNELNGNLRVRFERSRVDDGFEAQTFPLYGTDVTLVSTNINKNIGDYFNLIHEYGHVLNHTFNKIQMFDYEKYALQEVAPLFFELVAGNYLEEIGLNKRDINKMLVHIFRDAVTGAGVDVFRTELIKNRKRFENENDVLDYLKNNFYDEVLIAFSADNPLSGNMHYVFSYIVAVELYMLYLKDPIDALNKLTRIMKINNLNAKQYYEFIEDLGIVPNLSMGEYLDSLKRKQNTYGR